MSTPADSTTTAQPDKTPATRAPVKTPFFNARSISVLFYIGVILALIAAVVLGYALRHNSSSDTA